MSKKRIIKFKNNILEDIKTFLLKDHNERHAFLYCNLAINETSIVFLIDKLITLKDDDISHSSTHVQISKDLVNEIFVDFVNSSYDGFISCHSHPFEKSDVWFSSIDDDNDRDLFKYFYDEIVNFKKHTEMVTIVFGQETIASRFFDTETNQFLPVDKIISMQSPIKNIIPTNNKKKRL